MTSNDSRQNQTTVSIPLPNHQQTWKPKPIILGRLDLYSRIKHFRTQKHFHGNLLCRFSVNLAENERQNDKDNFDGANNQSPVNLISFFLHINLSFLNLESYNFVLHFFLTTTFTQKIWKKTYMIVFLSLLLQCQYFVEQMNTSHLILYHLK